MPQEVCTEERKKEEQKRKEERKKRRSDRSKKCRKKRTWLGRLFCRIVVTIRYVWETVWETVWVWVEWLKCVKTEPSCPKCFPGGEEGYANKYEPPGDGVGGVQAERKEYFAKSGSHPGGDAKLTMKFLGTNSIFVSDGTTRLIIDPYFSRPRIPSSCFTKSIVTDTCAMIGPDEEIIYKTLMAAEIFRVDAILMTHTHYDHALDVAAVASVMTRIWRESSGSLTHIPPYPKPQLIGSRSIIGIGFDEIPEGTELEGLSSGPLNITLRDVDFREVQNHGASFQVGTFKVTFFEGRHATILLGSTVFPGKITKELWPPYNFAELLEGEHTYCIRIEHELGTILNLGSANYNPGRLENVTTDYLIVGIAGYDSKFFGSFQTDFFDEVVRKTDPKRVFFSHWDDFGIPLDQPPKWVFGSIPGLGPTWSVKYFKGKKYKNTETGSEVSVELLPLWKDIHLPAV